MHLVIVESPAKTKTISKFLGKGYIVESSYGHVRDLPKSNKDAVDIKAGFLPRYVIPEKKAPIVSKLKKLSEKAESVILATDLDREGEAIAWHLIEALDLSPRKVKRIVFSEITKDAVVEALRNPRGIDQDLRRAQEARRVLDRLVGYDLSGLIWKKVRYGLSAGRVQSPALRIIVEREREISSFNPEKYWVITADAANQEGDTITLTCTEDPASEARMKEIMKKAKKAGWKIQAVQETNTKRSPYAPFTTSTLQQRGSSLLGFSPSRTMRAAQRLYEAGCITYMRTDSTALAKAAQAQLLSFVEKEFGKNYVTPRTYKTRSKLAQEAHEAIRPTDVKKRTAGRNADQKKLYELIRSRTIASQMADAKFAKTKLVVRVGDENVPDFTANGSRILFDGWLAADPAARGEDTLLPKVSENEELNLAKIESEEKETQPLPRYSEAGLVKELEKRGIGRPSTYAAIIATLQNRGYVEKEGRALRPTDVGEVVSTFLEQNFAEYISDTFTAEMENELDEIARGEREYEKTLKSFYGPFHKTVKDKEKTTEKLTTLGDAPKKFTCPKCKGKMIIKLGRSGKFLSCAKFPDCDGSRTIEGEAIEEPKETGEVCSGCGKGKLVIRHGKYGKFVGCNRYPKCKYVKSDPDTEQQNSTGVSCQKCEPGEMIERRGKYGLFYSCSKYPECKYAIRAKPTGKMCKECGALQMQGTKTIPERCSDRKCSNHNPHKVSSK